MVASWIPGLEPVCSSAAV